MQRKLNTSHSVRSVLTALADLSETSLAAARYRWDASGLVYDPLAELAEYPSDRYNRLLQSMVDRKVEPEVEPEIEPGVSELPLPTAQPDPGRPELRPQRSAMPHTISRPARTGPAAGASPERPGQNSPVRKSGRNAVRIDSFAAPPGSAPDFEVDDSAVSRIISRYNTRPTGDGSTGGSLNLQATEDGVDLPRGRRTGVTHPEGRSKFSADRAKVSPQSPFDKRLVAGHAREQEAESIATGLRRESRFLNGTALPPQSPQVQRRLPDPAGNNDPVIGKSSLSSRGLTTPIALDKAFSADRLSAWADPAGRIDTPPAPLQSPKADEAKPVVPQQESINGKTHRNKAGMDDNPTRSPGTVPPELSSGFSTLGRLVHRWQADQEETPRPGPAPLEPASGREMTRPSANASLNFQRLPSSELSPGASSDADFARRLENVLLRESRRHGIVVEDQ